MPKKIVLSKRLKSNNHLLDHKFSDSALAQLENNPEFHKRVIFSRGSLQWNAILKLRKIN